MISDVERCHVEEQLFGPIVLRHAEYDIEFDPPRAYYFSTGDDASESGAALLNATFVHLHFLERIFIDEVQSAATVHEYQLGRLRQGCGVFVSAYYLMRKSRRLLIPYWFL